MFCVVFVSLWYAWKKEDLGKGGTCFFTRSKICAGKKDLKGTPQAQNSLAGLQGFTYTLA